MIRLDPALIVVRVRVEKGTGSLYDEVFHLGVNIIRGENSSGKSTILNFIHYGLGGDVHDWSEVALLCDQVLVEVRLNGKPAVLLRPVSHVPQQAMSIYFGTMNNALAAPLTEWERFPYRRSLSKESFSQVLFRLLGIPEAASEESGNITMHQVMRLLYADQLSPVDEIFAHEGFDNAKIREAVGRLLCGAFDAEMYSAELENREIERKFHSVSGELRSLYHALGQASHSLNLNWVEEQKERNRRERHETSLALDELLAAASNFQTQPPSLASQRQIYEQVVEKQQAIASRTAERDSLRVSIADSASFMDSLEQKLTSLRESELFSKEIGIVRFPNCPACYAEIAVAPPGVCVLCKNAFDPEVTIERIGGLINETALQLRQSRLLQEKRHEQMASLEASIATLESAWAVLSARYAEVQSRPTSEYQQKINELNRRMGYFDRRDEDLAEKSKLIEVLSDLSATKLELSNRLAELRDRMERIRASQERRLADAYFAISDWVRRLLMRDLKRQDSFENPQKVDFSFGDNKISVDGHTYFSASSRAILKSAFLLGLFVTATQKDYFRHPRFAMLDTIEDKGMEAARSQNFQRIIVSIVEEAPVQCQIIFGTAMIAEELNVDRYTVGRFYTRDAPSLIFA